MWQLVGKEGIIKGMAQWHKLIQWKYEMKRIVVEVKEFGKDVKGLWSGEVIVYSTLCNI